MALPLDGLHLHIADVTGDVRYVVLLHPVGSNDWVEHTKSDGTDVPTFTAPAGTYDKVSVLTKVDDQEIGCTHADLNLTVTASSQTLAAPTNVTFAANPDNADEFTVTVTGLTAGKIYIMRLSDQADGNGNHRNSSCEAADTNGTVIFRMGGARSVEMATTGYYRILEQVSNTVTATTCVTEVGYRGDWTAATLGGSSSGGDSGDATVTDTITIVYEDPWVSLEWKDYGYAMYQLQMVDSNGSVVEKSWESGTGLDILNSVVPRPKTAGTYSYDLVLYAADSDYNVGDKLAVLEDAIAITVEGAPMDYAMSFNDPAMGKHTITFFNENPMGVASLNGWYDKKGEMGNRGWSGGSLSKYTTKYEDRGISDGMSYDLRSCSVFEVSGQTLVITMTPESLKTYVAPPATNTVEFTTNGIGVLRLNWDYDAPTDYDLSNANYLLLQFSADGGTTWPMEMKSRDTATTSVWLSDSNVIPGTYDKFRVLTGIYTSNGLEELEWFTANIHLTVTYEAPTAQATFTATETEGLYNVTYTGLYYNSDSDRGFLNVSYTDDAANGSRSASGSSIHGVTETDTSTEKYIPDGYFRLDVFRSAVANGTTGSVIMQVGEWAKCIPNEE